MFTQIIKIPASTILKNRFPEVLQKTAICCLLFLTGFLPSALQAQGTSEEEWCARIERNWSWGGFRRGQDIACEVREEQIQASGRLRVDAGQNGSIYVQGWDKDTVLLRSMVWAAARNFDRAEELMKDITIDTGGTVRPRGDSRMSGGQRWGVSFEIFVPNDYDLDLETYNGGVDVSGVNGDIRLRAYNGGINLDDVAGDVRGRTMNGGLDVTLTGERWNGDGLDLDTTNGGVRLNFPEEYNAELDTGTVNGHMTTEFPILVRGNIGREIHTTLGEGGPAIRATTTNGGVRIARD